MTKLAPVFALVAMVSINLSASDLVLYDADGDAIGSVLDIDGVSINVYFPDAYWTTIDPATGQVAITATHLSYAEDNCQGSAYLVGSTQNWSVIRNAVLAANSGNPPPTFVKTEWSAPSQSITVESELELDVCQDLHNEDVSVVAVTEIDPATYGMKDLGGGVLGYPLPFSWSVETDTQGSGIFCDGFENCPQPE